MVNAPLVNKLELHYFFSDSSHSMDAFVRNKCESELLAIIREISSITGIEIRIETEAYAEGGLRERFKLLAKNQFVLTTLLAIITSVATTVPSGYLLHKLTTDPEVEELEKQKLRNEVEQGRLEQQKIKTEIERNELENHRLRLDMRQHERELNEASRVSPVINVTQVVTHINDTSYKVLKHRSSFYKALNSYPKVTQVSFTRLTSDNQEAGAPVSVVYQDFSQFIVSTDELPPIRDEQAVVEIISPVLKPGNYKWKGIYLKTGHSIDFYMKDQDFKEDVVKARIPFRNGSRIACVLDISRKLSETGEAVNTTYAVSIVTATFEGGTMIETSQGRNYRTSKNQLKLTFE
ncbi:hypothetical protein CLV24_11729 [Pontibacter ummariensis]|uniref:Uncharacterized protein n=1 Tax=Pontibacter ummariensis TaxID=1610492 RepID=A0A239IFL8_9BACT|nr:hypothetical protein [Pontibacter ummariensis]PRY09825.1 hypothetical protein CLV24_11729 [Pontibacter ummariensis]SNS92329.1 hypothetical protein SAMN06296052_11729 [Pontibacter ummariensis]